MNISKIEVFQILDSRGWPTLAGFLELSDGRRVCASIPSGSSVGKYEAIEKRDGDTKKYFGKSVFKAAQTFRDQVSPIILGRKPDFSKIDDDLLSIDGTGNKSNLGANVILLGSILTLKAQAKSLDIEIFEFISHVTGIKPSMPFVKANLINGGRHADNSLLFQEFMIQPTVAESFEDQQQMIVSVYHTLSDILKSKGYSTCVGHEGGFAPDLRRKGVFGCEREALDILTKAVDSSGNLGKVNICLDVAASEFFDEQNGYYNVGNDHVFSDDLVQFYSDLLNEYSIGSIEDGLAQDDWVSWKNLNESLGNRVEIVADDLCATNPERVTKALENKVCNAILIKPNQVGTISETLKAVSMSKSGGLGVVPSHRSGETIDSFLSDFSVGVAAGSCKIGAPARGERVAKYNRLAAIDLILRGGV
ncbi:phosphopyruvate hydratase [Candidatus Dependentiae bacterium]